MKYLPFLILILFASCDSGNTGWDKLSSGYEYINYTKLENKKAVAGDVVILDLEVIDDENNVLDDSRDARQRPSIAISANETEEIKRNPILSLVKVMSERDSATVRVPIDSLPNPPETFRHSSYIDYRIKIIGIQNQEAYNAAQKSTQERILAEKTAGAEKVFKAYQDNTLNATKIELESGIIVYLIKDTKAAKPQPGEQVSVNYYGFFRDGTSFDNSYRVGRPFTFAINRGGVIRGWDIGIPEIPEGGTALLEIPYEYAYGAAGNPPTIPAESDLLFFVELEKIIK
jgi:FKBP-type peptidyl-prolyl cis-trans isomerase